MNTEQLEKLDLLSTNELLELLGTELQRNRLDAKDSDAPEVAGKKHCKHTLEPFKTEFVKVLQFKNFCNPKKHSKELKLLQQLQMLYQGFSLASAWRLLVS